MSKPVLAAICIIFGILVIFSEKLLNYIVGIFFIVEGCLLLTEYLELRRQQRPQLQQRNSELLSLFYLDARETVRYVLTKNFIMIMTYLGAKFSANSITMERSQ